MTLRRASLAVLVCLAQLCTWAAQASAQSAPAPTSSPKPKTPSGWVVDFEFWDELHRFVGDGIGILPPPGATFMTFRNGPSRYVPSWFFGDGSTLVNQVLAAAGIPPDMKLSPLDSILTHNVVTSGQAFGGGVGLSRMVSPRIGFELRMDVSQNPLSLSSAAVDSIAGTRASYTAAFTTLLNTIGQFIGPQITTDLEQRSGGVRFSVGAGIRVALPTIGTFHPYAVGGGGFDAQPSGGPGLTLTGHYSFMAQGFSTRVFDETDHVEVSYSLPHLMPVVFGGAGLSKDLSRTRGIAVDIRYRASWGDVVTQVKTLPVTTVANAAVSLPVTPTIQFSDSKSLASLSIASTHETLRLAVHGGLVLGVHYYLRF